MSYLYMFFLNYPFEHRVLALELPCEGHAGIMVEPLKYSVLIFVKKYIYKMQHLEGSGTPVLRVYIYIYIYIYI